MTFSSPGSIPNGTRGCNLTQILPLRTETGSNQDYWVSFMSKRIILVSNFT